MTANEIEVKLTLLFDEARRVFLESVATFADDPSEHNLSEVGVRLTKLRKVEATLFLSSAYSAPQLDIAAFWKGGGGGFSGGGASGGW